MTALPPEYSQTVHGPLQYWAGTRPDHPALCEGEGEGKSRLSFSELERQVARGVLGLEQEAAALTCWVDNAGAEASDTQGSATEAPITALPMSPTGMLVRFLSIIASGRTAAVASPDWPPQVREQVLQTIAVLAQSQANPLVSSRDTNVHMKQAMALASAPDPARPESPFYIGFTSGSSGLPKGFRRNHRSWTSSFEIFIETFGAPARETVLVPGALSHSLFLFGAMLGLWTGAGVHLQQNFSAGAALDTLASAAAGALVAVPSQLVLMLELAQRRKLGPITATRLILIGGAPWNRSRTAALRQLFPAARIIEFYGASETSFISWTDSDSSLADTVAGRPFGNVELRITPVPAAAISLPMQPGSEENDTGKADAASPDAASTTQATITPSLGPVPSLPPQAGLIHVRSPMVFMDYVTITPGQDASAALQDGEWLSVRDVGYLDEDGLLHLLGREQRMLLVQGKNLFPEEVENVLSAHPAVLGSAVLGIADPLRGNRAVALLHLGGTVTAAGLKHWCANRLEGYKIPRRFYVCNDWPLTGSGKTDHKRLASLWLPRITAGAESLP